MSNSIPIIFYKSFLVKRIPKSLGLSQTYHNKQGIEHLVMNIRL